jgi:LmbE family N-acetylglucosaminyl deacetylase
VTTLDRPTPDRVLAVGAHPDDIEFGCGATLAKWADAGAHVELCICTDGSKGTWDAAADTRALVDVRRREQQAAAAVLGVAGVEFLGFVDGELDHGPVAQAMLAEVIRRTRPDVVLGHDPWAVARLHPDHRHAGLLVLDAIVAARDPHFFPEQLRDGRLASHRPSFVLLFESEQPDHVERVEHSIDRKAEALLRHRSQWQSTMGIDDRPEEQQATFLRSLHDEAEADGIRAGVSRAEAFRTITGI